LEIVGHIPTLFEYEGNIYQLSSVPDRVPGDGGMLYVANASLTMGDAEEAFACIAYFKPNGELHHVDELRLPDNTAKAYAFIQADVLDPYLYNTDSNYEYLLWHYTWKGEGAIGTDLSLIVVDNTGRILAKRQLSDGHSNESAFVSNTPDQRYIVVSWRDASSWNNKHPLSFISLPLDTSEGEGTVENPYLIRTWGDFDQVRNNLTSHFALASNIDLQNRAIRPIEGAFTGSIDGRGNALKNLYVSAENKGALFMQVGDRPDNNSSEPTAVLKNLIFDGVTFVHGGTSFGTKQYGLLSHTARFAEFNKVQVVNPKVAIAGVNVEIGTLAHMAEKTSFVDCAVKNADYDVERGNGMGGIVFDSRNSQITGCYVSGKISGRQNIGGIAGRTNVDPTVISDCHVNADITASVQNVGGIVGDNNSRSLLKNNVIEGSITGTNSVGGVVGNLAATEGYDQFDLIVEGNVVALDAFNVGENPVAAHRIVGYSSIDDGEQMKWVGNPDWDPSDPNSPSGSYEMIPAVPEDKIGENHVVSGIDAVDGTEGLSTEGTTTSIEDADDAFFENLGFKFGSDSKAPWVRPSFMSRLPTLYYEEMIGATLRFSAEVYKGDINSTVTVVVIGEGFDIFDAAGSGLLSVASANSKVASWAYDMVTVEEYPTNGVGLPFTLGEEAGETEITVSYKEMTATAKIVVVDPAGVGSITAETIVLVYANGVIAAANSAIEVYDVQGRKIATGFGELSTADLAAGLYVVRAVSADNAATMKIMVK
ncbi:MAG: T9SS type A sorting domain-containing protein, partial [Muribaculaceae bacterium]|nr:T9SS type A sorting domain-containing protein [Muribaculaceae bacterium]